MIHSVAVIGVGAMGGPMAQRLLAAGYELTACDPNDAATAKLAESGARVAQTPADCVRADLVIVMVATPDQVEQVLFGTAGLVSAVQPERRPLVALMGTMSPQTSREMHRRLTGEGVSMIEAPVSGGIPAAQKGTLSVMIGGSEEAVAEVTPVFRHFGTEHFHVGDIGAAQTVKILNNILGVVNGMVSAETYRLAIEHGLDLRQTARILEASTGRNWLSVGDGPGPKYAAMTANQDFASAMTIVTKDLALAKALASEVEGSYPLIEGFAAMLNTLGPETRENWIRVASKA